MSEGRLLSNLDYLPLERLWIPGDSADEYSQRYLGNTVEELIKYSNHKPLSYWEDEPFLFLIGQAGSGKSAYLRMSYKDQPGFLYVDLKRLQKECISFVKESPEWSSFIESNEDTKTLTIIIDGWDELIEERQVRNHFLNLLTTSIPSEQKSSVRIRIASRPELDEVDIIEDFQRECAWLSRFESEASTYRVILAPLCREQIERCWKHFTNKIDPSEFFEWCNGKDISIFLGHIQTLIFLIKSHANSDNWNSLTEFWETIVGNKVLEVKGRDQDRNRVSNHFSRSTRLDMLGNLALFYLLSGRNALPHPDNSCDIYTLLIDNNLNGSNVTFLLSSPVFTPGGTGNIHFAQAQEAEFLAARRLFTCKINFDNVKNLLVHKGLIPNNLQGLSRWYANYDTKWLNFLSNEMPSFAVNSLNLLHADEVRDDVIKKWWDNEETNHNNWYQVQQIRDVLPHNKPDWIEDEVKSMLHDKDNGHLATLLSFLNRYKVTPELLDDLSRYLTELNPVDSAYTEIIIILGKNDYGDEEFWIALSDVDIGKEKIDCSEVIIEKLKSFHVDYKYITNAFPSELGRFNIRLIDLMYNFFSSIPDEYIDDALAWVLKERDRPNNENNLSYDNSWIFKASEGLLSTLINYKRVHDIISLAINAWKSYRPFLELFSSNTDIEKEKEKLIDIGLCETIFSNFETLKIYSRNAFHDPWIADSFGIPKILEKYELSIKDCVDNEYANLLLSFLRNINFKYSEIGKYATQLNELKTFLIKQGQYDDSALRGIIDPWKIEEEINTKAKLSHEQHINLLRRSEVIKEEQEERKKVVHENFICLLNGLESKSWYEIFNILSYGYKSIRGPVFIPTDSFDHDFWKTPILQRYIPTIIEKAEKYIRETEWEIQWDLDFKQKTTSGRSFTVSSITYSPNLAWKLLYHYKGQARINIEFNDIERGLWLKYFWGFYGFYLEDLNESQWDYLLEKTTDKTLTKTWDELEKLQGKGAKIPSYFATTENWEAKKFIEAIVKEPFSQTENRHLLDIYLRNNSSEFLRDWFYSWQKLQDSEHIVSELKNMVFLLNYSVQPAWEWLRKNHCFFEYLIEKTDLDSFRGFDLSLWPDDAILETFLFLYKMQPPENDPRHDDGEAYSPGWQDGVQRFREALLNRLIRQNNPNAEKYHALIKDKFPSFDPLGYIIETIKQDASNDIRQWDLSDIRTLLTDGELVIIKDDWEFTQWIAELLREFDKSAINGEYSLSTLVWDEYKDEKEKPIRKSKHEDAFSNLAIHWLRWRTNYINVLGMRENPIVLKSSKNKNKKQKGMRLDLHFKFPEDPKIQTIVEVKKGSNSTEWRSKGIKQLLDYLQKLGKKSGIYLVFRDEAPKRTSAVKMLSIIKENIDELCSDDINIIPIVIDVEMPEIEE